MLASVSFFSVSTYIAILSLARIQVSTISRVFWLYDKVWVGIYAEDAPFISFDFFQIHLKIEKMRLYSLATVITGSQIVYTPPKMDTPSYALSAISDCKGDLFKVSKSFEGQNSQL